MRPGWGIVALLLPLQVAAQEAPARVTGIRVLPVAGQTEIVVEVAGGEVAWRDFVLESPARIVVDIENARAALPAQRFDAVNRGGVTGIRASQFSPTVVRVAIDLARAAEHTVTRAADGIHVRFAGGGGVFSAWNTATAALDAPALAARPPAQAAQQPRITVTFQDADIRDVLATFAEFTGRSIVAGSEVTGMVTATIREQPWDLALETILRAYGLDAEELPSGIIRVDAVANMQTRETQEPLVTRPFRVNYVPVAELQATLDPLKSERGRIGVSATTNTLIVTDVASVVEALAAMVSQLDVPTPQVSIQAKIIFVNRTEVEDLGITYDLKDSRGNSVNQLASVPDPLNPGQVTDDDIISLGGNSIAALGNATVRVPGPQLRTITSLVLGRYTLINFIEALQSSELSDVQAVPLITALDNVEAEILVGEETPIRVVDVGAASGAGVSLPTATTQLVETGIILRVTPHVTADRRILMQLHAERSSATAVATEIGVRFDRQRGTTRLMVDDGETAVIGGLTVTEVFNTRVGIPFLMDLPVVGRLFRRERAQEQKRDLLIMVTPHIVENRAG